MSESKWHITRDLTRKQFCEITHTPEDWHIFKERAEFEFYECEYLGRTYWRCNTENDLWMFTKVNDEIWFKVRNRYDKGPYWSEWHDWP